MKGLQTEQKLLSEFIESAMSLQKVRVKYNPQNLEYDLAIQGTDKLSLVKDKIIYNFGTVAPKGDDFVLTGMVWAAEGMNEADRIGTLIGVRYARSSLEETGDLAVYRVGDQIFVYNKLNYFFDLSYQDKLKAIADSWRVGYPFLFDVRRTMEQLMGHYRYLRSDGWMPTSDFSDNFKGIDFYQGTVVGDQIFATTAVSLKTTLTTNVENWLASEPIKQNIEFLKTGLDPTIGLISNNKRMFISDAEIHIYMPKANITENLQKIWLPKLNTVDPKIKFEIKALEDYIK